MNQWKANLNFIGKIWQVFCVADKPQAYVETLYLLYLHCSLWRIDSSHDFIEYHIMNIKFLERQIDTSSVHIYR
jgi:hypothetical protein